MTRGPARVGARGAYRNGIESRRRILTAAATTFGRSGFAGSSLRQLAAEVGVSHASLVQHFGTKDELLLAVLRYWDEDIASTLPELRGLAFIRGLADLVRDHNRRRSFIELFLTTAVEAANPNHPAHEYMTTRARRVRTRILDELKTAAADGEIQLSEQQHLERSARELVAMMNGLELQWLLDPKVDLESIFDPYLENWLNRLGG